MLSLEIPRDFSDTQQVHCWGRMLLRPHGKHSIGYFTWRRFAKPLAVRLLHVPEPNSRRIPEHQV
jgi:hypothetical protein